MTKTDNSEHRQQGDRHFFSARTAEKMSQSPKLVDVEGDYLK